MKIFACIGIQTHYILTQVFLLHLSNKLKPLLACTIVPNLYLVLWATQQRLQQPLFQSVVIKPNDCNFSRVVVYLLELQQSLDQITTLLIRMKPLHNKHIRIILILDKKARLTERKLFLLRRKSNGHRPFHRKNRSSNF